MDHPNIARVLDGGATETAALLRHGTGPESGSRTSTTNSVCRATQRLRLFIQVCRCHPARPPEGRDPPGHQAVQRPSDGERRPGGAQGDRLPGSPKATGQALTDKTLVTRFQGIDRHAGLLRAPSRPNFSSVDIDTRSDVYSPRGSPLRIVGGQAALDNAEILKGVEGMRHNLRHTPATAPPPPGWPRLGRPADAHRERRRTDLPRLKSELQGDWTGSSSNASRRTAYAATSRWERWHRTFSVP